jgi:hypothetical protein
MLHQVSESDFEIIFYHSNLFTIYEKLRAMGFELREKLTASSTHSHDS